ncbi:nucleotidyl transferase AbiEii/AbiGii toxin family protein [Janthinobacterium sp. PC23-8]|uniref:nucleotidyl transferase AbiEii/AbiGii toxin family protein n=1 Tax=Janthinobacterium sp. PC23-8 TaxID=2012679 RepID=UPI000B964D82|nr:nucleotidyl transferase AbiEii/AbiGii toxin family protein [Janthinobacterium sp. PC23-8]OYO32016.1 hypothetical protein CD932_13435 [Janthinobacterium sp. PC23-8]
MKKISAVDAQKLADFALESPVALPAYVLEKDMHVVDAMKILAALPASPLFKLVFCGGTCLSKAYGILERMSEDIDYKVVPTAAALILSKTRRMNELKTFRQSVTTALVVGGFTGDDAIATKVRDEGAYCAISVEYDSVFDKPVSLRPHLLIELNYTELAKPSQSQEVGLLLDRLLSGSYSAPLKLECVSLEEALAEKIVSFPRRLSKQMADQVPKGAKSQKIFNEKFLTEELHWDKALIRHLLDVKILSDKYPALTADLDGFGSLLATAINKDAFEFKSHDDFKDDPAKELQASMAFAKTSKTLSAQYVAFVSDMVYGADKPSYSDAIDHFESVLKTALQSPVLQASILAAQQAEKLKVKAGLAL